MAKPLVVIFARAPRYGAIKTRLARDIGAGETLRFYRKALGDLVQRLQRDVRFDVELAVTPDYVRDCWPTIRVIAQGRGDLGRRMVRALRGAGSRPAIVIGSDIPEIAAAHVASAFRALGKAPFVLGPAHDGGYWLIGARHPHRMRASVLDGVRWSGAHTMQDTIDRLGEVAVLNSVLEDIDDGAAYRRYQSRRA
ncbi:MAG: TIGR04282 family arsenosugar biosynthesis glycosyltransferase [Micropepsaceae bacterium]